MRNNIKYFLAPLFVLLMGLPVAQAEPPERAKDKSFARSNGLVQLVADSDRNRSRWEYYRGNGNRWARRDWDDDNRYKRRYYRDRDRDYRYYDRRYYPDYRYYRSYPDRYYYYQYPYGGYNYRYYPNNNYYNYYPQGGGILGGVLRLF